MASSCPTAAQLEELLKGSLSPAESASLDEHLVECAACRQQLNALAAANESWLNGKQGHRAEPLHSPPLREVMDRLKAGEQMPPSEKPGDRIGRYKLLEQIGEGGCGVVYVAEQEEPVRRRVALKVIKLGMDTRQVIARFEAERQALAMMDHPNIARVLDAGATENGRPFFVMELVRGIRITDYCDEAKLSTRARLDLFIQVCHAVQHAHQKGIIHRDIKPSNILVTINDGVPVPKVIDFGIAKATEGRLTDKTVYTQLNQFIGTPAYMSPEQAMLTSLDIDTRSDIYALGVLLYELLTGKTPFDAQELLAIGLDEMRRTIREQEPPRPSTRLSTLPGQELSTTAQRRGLDAQKLVSELRGDLDWIVMKALEKERSRRYESANGLASDIQRRLNNEPVGARPPNLLYLTGKFLRKRRLQVTFAALVLGSLLTAAALGLQYRRANALHLTAQINQLRHEESAVLSRALAGLDGSEDEKRSVQACLSRLAERVRTGSGSSSDHELLARFLTRKVSLRGRRLQTADQPEIALCAASDPDYDIEGVGVILQPMVALDGTPVPVTGYPVYLASYSRQGGSATAMAGELLPIPKPLNVTGIRGFSAIIEAQLVHAEGGVTAKKPVEPRNYDAIGTSVRIVLPRFERYFLQQLPAQYPLELIDDRAGQKITAGLTVSSARLVMSKTNRVQCEFRIIVPLLSPHMPLALRVDLTQLGDTALNFSPCGLVVDDNQVVTMTDGDAIHGRRETSVSGMEDRVEYGIKFVLPDMPQLKDIKPSDGFISGRLRIRSAREVALRRHEVEHFLFVPEIIQTVQFTVQVGSENKAETK